MRKTPNSGRERESWKTWGRYTVTRSRLKAMKFLNRVLGALKFRNFFPIKSTTAKSVAHPVSINRSVLELTFTALVAAVEAESWSEWLSGIDTWLPDMEWHWFAITIPVESTDKEMAKSRAIRLYLLATTSMGKLYQLSLFRRIFEEESRVNCDWRYKIMLSRCFWNFPYLT